MTPVGCMPEKITRPELVEFHLQCVREIEEVAKRKNISAQPLCIAFLKAILCLSLSNGRH